MLLLPLSQLLLQLLALLDASPVAAAPRSLMTTWALLQVQLLGSQPLQAGHHAPPAAAHEPSAQAQAAAADADALPTWHGAQRTPRRAPGQRAAPARLAAIGRDLAGSTAEHRAQPGPSRPMGIGRDLAGSSRPQPLPASSPEQRAGPGPSRPMGIGRDLAGSSGRPLPASSPEHRALPGPSRPMGVGRDPAGPVSTRPSQANSSQQWAAPGPSRPMGIGRALGSAAAQQAEPPRAHAVSSPAGLPVAAVWQLLSWCACCRSLAGDHMPVFSCCSSLGFFRSCEATSY